jgi:thioredoxin-related protein
MKNRVCFLFFFILTSCFLSAQEPLRKWTNKEEKSIEARMLSHTADTVTLMLSNGRMYVLPLDTLSEGDIGYVKQAQSTPTTHNVPKGGWFENFEDAKSLAAAQKSPILMLFTGSDWCPPCRRLEGAVLSKREFKDFAEKELVLMVVDFPKGKKQRASLKKANQKLQSDYKVRGYPTLILVDKKGIVKSRISTGAASPADFIKTLKPHLP